MTFRRMSMSITSTGTTMSTVLAEGDI